MNEPRTLPGLLARAAESSCGVRFFDRKGGTTEYLFSDLYADAAALSAQLQSRVQKGDRVGLIFSTSDEFVRSLFAVSMTGAVPVCLAPPRLGRGSDYSETTAGMIRRAGAAFVLCEQSIQSSLEKVQASAGVEIAAPPDREMLRSASESSGSSAAQMHRADSVQAEDAALLQFSSGTTVDPKPVMLTHANLAANTSAILARFPGNLRDHSGLSWLPMHHDMGLIGGLLTAVAGCGWGTFVRPEDFVLRPALWLNALSATRATISPCPNFALKLCTDRVEDSEIEAMDLSAWQIALVGAETVHLETLRAFAKRFAPAKFRYATFTPVYGLAEATLAVSFSSVEKEPLAVSFDRALLGSGTAARSESADAVEICSVGTALDGIEIEVKGESGSLPENHVGRIFVRGPSVMGGYLVPGGGIKAQTGELDTGDLGFFFEGELFIYGRAKDVIIINGRNYDPAYIEFAAEGVPGLRHERTAAFAVETGRGTEGFMVLVEKEKGDLRGESEVAGLVRSSIITKTGLIPDSVHIIDAGRMPRTTSGKVRRQEARTRFLSGSLVAIASASS